MMQSSPAASVRTAVEQSERAQLPRLAVVLTDGSVLTGRAEVRPDDTRLSLYVEDDTKRIDVPLEMTAGLYSASFAQAVEEYYMGQDVQGPEFPSLAHTLDTQALSRAREHTFEITPLAVGQPELPEGALGVRVLRLKHFRRWTPPAGFAPLYCDWDYFTRRAGGPRDAGIEILGFGLSGGGQPSLLGDAYRALTADQPQDRRRICDQSEGTVIGFVSSTSSVVMRGEDRLTLRMDGAMWTAMIIGHAAAGEADAGSENAAWTLAYFATDGRVCIDRSLWPAVGSPITFFGEVQQDESATDRGAADCWLKVRVAACLPSG